MTENNPCGDCHLCCEWFLINLCDIPEDAAAFFREWGVEMEPNDEGGVLMKIPSRCQHLTDKGCAIYDRRPTFCRDFRCDRMKEDMKGQ